MGTVITAIEDNRDNFKAEQHVAFDFKCGIYFVLITCGVTVHIIIQRRFGI